MVILTNKEKLSDKNDGVNWIWIFLCCCTTETWGGRRSWIKLNSLMFEYRKRSAQTKKAWNNCGKMACKLHLM